MSIRSAFVVTSCLSILLGISGPAVRADAVILKGGGEIRGEVLSDPTRSAAESTVAIRTPSGATIVVARDQIESIVRRRPVFEEYETRRRRVSESVAGHWELAEWCREKSLPRERLVHLKSIVALDPEHVAAHRGLGHVRRDGKWTTQEEHLATRGFVKHKGKQVLPQELELALRDERIGDAEKSWLKQVRQWQGWLAGERLDRVDSALARLREIHNSDAVPALVRQFRDAPAEEHRLLYVEILSQIDGDRPVAPLAAQSLADESKTVRDSAISGIRRKDSARAIPVYVRALKHRQNAIVNRAADALGRLGDSSTVSPLIEALITRHEYRVMMPDTNPLSSTESQNNRSGIVLPPGVDFITPAGRMASEAQQIVSDRSYPVAGMIPVSYEKDQENQAVLAALNLLTSQNFAFDAPAWRKWHSTQKTAAGPRRPPRP